MQPLSSEDREWLKDNKEAPRVLLKLLQAIKADYDLKLAKCRLDKEELFTERAKLEGMGVLIGAISLHLKPRDTIKPSQGN